MKKKESLVSDFTTGSVKIKMFYFAIPLVLSGLLQTIYSMVDMIIVGRFVGSSALAAVSIGGDILMILTFISMGIANAGQIRISQYIGAGERDKVGQLIGTLFIVLIGSALFMTIVCFSLRNQILNWVNTPVEARSYALSYITVSIIGLVFIYGYNLVSAILRGMGDSKRPFLFIAIASITNLILDFVFVTIFHWETFGAALATVIGQAISFICGLIVLYSKRKDIGFDFAIRRFRIYKDVFIPLMKLGIPMIIQSASITFSKLFVNSWINSYGLIASTVSGMGTKLDTLCNTFSQAISTAASTMIGQNIGAKRYERISTIMKTALMFVLITAVPFAVITFLIPEKVFGIFNNDKEVLEMAITYVPIALILYCASVSRVPMLSLINGSGNSLLNLAVALSDGIIVRIGLALFLGIVLDMGVYGFWYGNAIAGFVPFFVGGSYYISKKWMRK